MRAMSVVLSSLCTAALLAPLAVPSASADEIRLVDGRVLEGEVISAPDAEVVDLRTGSGSLVVVQHFARAQVLSISYGTSPRQKAIDGLAADRARLGDGGGAEQWWALAERARELGDSVAHRELAVETIARDRNHAPARKALGQIRQRGVWMRPHEAAIARGEVMHNGRSMTWAEREAAVAQAARDRELALARRSEREKEARERRLRAAAAAAAYYDAPTETILPGYRGSYARECRVVYWPVVGAYPHPNVIHANGGSGLTVSAGGQGNGFSWGFTWR